MLTRRRKLKKYCQKDVLSAKNFVSRVQNGQILKKNRTFGDVLAGLLAFDGELNRVRSGLGTEVVP